MSNKFEIGDTVELKAMFIRQAVKSIPLLYSNPVSKEFVTQHASEVFMLLGAFLRFSKSPVGKVVTYGAEEEPMTRRKFLVVNVKNELGAGEGVIVTEDDVKLVKGKKKK